MELREMVFCSRCGRQNPDDARYCDRCALPLVKEHHPQTGIPSPAAAPSPPPPPSGARERIEGEMSDAGKRFGRRMERFGERMDKDFERFGTEWGDWFDRTFGVLVPLFGALVGIVLLIIVIAGAEQLHLYNVSRFFIANLILFFILMIVLGYASFARKKFKKETGWSAPLTTAIGLAIALWILSELHYALWLDTGIPGLDSLSLVFRVLIFVALVLVIVVGYVFMYVVIPREWGAMRPPRGEGS